MIYLVQTAIEKAIAQGHLITAGWITLITGLVMFVVAMGFAIYRKESYRYWRVTISVIAFGFAAMSGLLEEVLKLVAKMIPGGG